MYRYFDFGNAPFNANHVELWIFGQFLKSAHFGFPVIGRQIRNDTRVVSVDDDDCDQNPSEGQDANRTSDSYVPRPWNSVTSLTQLRNFQFLII